MTAAAALLLALVPAGDVLLQEEFGAGPLRPPWGILKGSWRVENGALRGEELPADKHAASVRYAVSFADVRIRLRFRLDGARFAAIVVNAPGTHLCRVLMRPGGLALIKDAESGVAGDQPRTLAETKTPLEPGRWYDLTVEMRGKRLTAALDGGEPLVAEYPGIARPKSEFRLPVSGSSASFDSIAVTALP